MLLKHTKNLCALTNSVYNDDDVLQEVIKKLSPIQIYHANEELIKAFGKTLANYTPISINIIDYWNKDVTNSSIYVPEEAHYYDWAFRFEDGVDETNNEFKNGYNEGPFSYDGHVTFDSKHICKEHDGFYINSLIGLQDKLAYTFMHNLYTVAEHTVNDYILQARLKEILKKIGYDKDRTSKFFDRINMLFGENSYVASKEYNARKGQQRLFKYTMKMAQDADIQGELTKKFYYKYESDEPFTYRIEGSLLPAIFESFVIPLVHPIGFTYSYENVCYERFTDLVLRREKLSAQRVYVYELCRSVDENDNKVSPGDDLGNPPQPLPGEGNDETVVCPGDPDNIPNFESEYTFATADGTGLWEGIQNDEGTGNILVRIREGTVNSGYFKNYNYKKYEFQNGNYLIEYIHPELGNKTIEYYRYDSGTDSYTLISRFIDRRHVNIFVEGLERTYETPIDEQFTIECVEEAPSGWFGFLGDASLGDHYGFDEGVWGRYRVAQNCEEWFSYIQPDTGDHFGFDESLMT